MLEKGEILWGPSDPKKRHQAREMRRAMTEAERVLWQALRRNALGGLHFRRQQVIEGFIADFYCHRAGLVVEVDGPVHDSQILKDRERNLALRQRDLTVVHFRNDRILTDLPRVLAEILAIAKTRLARTVSRHSSH
jgi:very-short-patch-repair endonuclease